MNKGTIAVIVAIVLLALFAGIGISASFLERASTTTSVSTRVATSYSTVTSTSLLYSTITQTSTSISATTLTSIILSTTAVHPVPNNVSVLFDNSGSFLTWRIDTPINGWGGMTRANSFNQTITPIYGGEQISVQASCTSSCNNSTNFSALLLLNDYPVAIASGSAFAGLLINYTL